MVIICPLIGGQLAADRFSKRCNAPRLGRICRVRPYPLARGQNVLVLLEDVGSAEGLGIVDTASMADGVVHNDE